MRENLVIFICKSATIFYSSIILSQSTGDRGGTIDFEKQDSAKSFTTRIGRGKGQFGQGYVEQNLRQLVINRFKGNDTYMSAGLLYLMLQCSLTNKPN